MVEVEHRELEIIENGFVLNESWQRGEAQMVKVREASFSIHRLARQTNSEVKQTALRAIGHAVASAHMAEHAMVASDYAIKLINLLFPQDRVAVTNERLWQIQLLKNIKE